MGLDLRAYDSWVQAARPRYSGHLKLRRGRADFGVKPAARSSDQIYRHLVSAHSRVFLKYRLEPASDRVYQDLVGRTQIGPARAVGIVALVTRGRGARMEIARGREVLSDQAGAYRPAIAINHATSRLDGK